MIRINDVFDVASFSGMHQMSWAAGVSMAATLCISPAFPW